MVSHIRKTVAALAGGMLAFAGPAIVSGHAQAAYPPRICGPFLDGDLLTWRNCSYESTVVAWYSDTDGWQQTCVWPRHVEGIDFLENHPVIYDHWQTSDC